MRNIRELSFEVLEVTVAASAQYSAWPVYWGDISHLTLQTRLPWAAATQISCQPDIYSRITCDRQNVELSMEPHSAALRLQSLYKHPNFNKEKAVEGAFSKRFEVSRSPVDSSNKMFSLN